MLYVISDIHGEFGLFLKMLEEIEFTERDTLIVAGDVIDRGQQSIEALEYIMSMPNITMLMGNHEAMFLQYLKTGDRIDKEMWMGNGGCVTLSGFEDLPQNRKDEVREFLTSLKYHYVYKNFLIVHSGLNLDDSLRNKEIDEIISAQDEEDLLWSRQEFYYFRGLDNYTIIFGHTMTYHLPSKENDRNRIWHDATFKDKIGIDCGAVKSGIMGCIRLDDLKEFYVSK